ncbi:MAG: DUF1810 domain-containing protein [Clostridia bacterium]|nr:DUF1810 domain-containing protein [Clostridia bacterium]
MNHYHIEQSGYDLNRFAAAQAHSYARALGEIRAGQKRSHWMWYIFPQLRGLGRSYEANYYGIDSLGEAQAYLAHPLLGPRLCQITCELNRLPGSNPTAVMGRPDDMKLRSCMTLFEAAGGGNAFSDELEKYYGGRRDRATLERIG